MSAAQLRPPISGAVSELAFARAQRNTVLIVDDLFSSRLLLAEIVRQIDGKLNLELFDTPSRALASGSNPRVSPRAPAMLVTQHGAGYNGFSWELMGLHGQRRICAVLER